MPGQAGSECSEVIAPARVKLRICSVHHGKGLGMYSFYFFEGVLLLCGESLSGYHYCEGSVKGALLLCEGKGITQIRDDVTYE